MRSSPNGIWILFLFFFIFGFADTLIPLLLIMAALTFFMVKAVKASKENNYTSRASSAPRSTVRRYGMSDSRHTAAQKARINAYLLKRFRNGDRAITLSSGTHHIVLTMKNGSFSSLDALEVDCDGHYFNTVGEFRQKYGELYDQMFDTLLTMEMNDVAVVQPTVVDVDYVPKSGTASASAASSSKPKNESKKTVKEEKQPSSAAEFREAINSLNDGIPDEEISNGLYETSALLKQLDDLERAFPEQKSKLKKLYTKYLPYLIGILKQYTKMQNVQTDANYEQNVKGLKDTLRHINSAMKDRLIPAMSETDSINLSADMSTLEAMLRKDGMTTDDDILAALKRQTADESSSLQE